VLAPHKQAVLAILKKTRCKPWLCPGSHNERARKLLEASLFPCWQFYRKLRPYRFLPEDNFRDFHEVIVPAGTSRHLVATATAISVERREEEVLLFLVKHASKPHEFVNLRARAAAG
jgi:hypothetical protein